MTHSRQSVAGYIRQSITPPWTMFASSNGFSLQAWCGAGVHGCVGLEIPEKFGGSPSSDYRFNALVLEEPPKVNLAVPSSTSAHVDVAAPHLIALTTLRQSARWGQASLRTCDGDRNG